MLDALNLFRNRGGNSGEHPTSARELAEPGWQLRRAELPEIPPLWYELKTTRFWLLIGTGIICILVADSIDTHAMLSRVRLTQSEYLEMLMTQSWYEHPTLWATIVREFGFACLIALVVGVLVERSARERHVNAARKLLRVVARDVFEAAIGSHLPPLIRCQTINTILRAPVIRTHIDLQYCIQELPERFAGRK